MAKLSMLVASTSQTVNIFIQDSSKTTGVGLTGLVYNTGSLIAYYALPKATPVAITLATLAADTTAYSSGGFKELDATHCPGMYRFDLPDASFASGRFSTIMLSGAANMAPVLLEIELTVSNNQVANLTAASIATGVWQDATGADFTATSSIGKSLYTSGVVPGGTNGLFIAGTNAATAITTGLTAHIIGTVDTVTTVTNQLTAAAIATGVWQDSTAGDFTIVSSIGKSLYTAGVVPGGTNGLFIAGTNAATAITTGLTAHIIGTVDTLTTYTGHTFQTANVSTLITTVGVAGAGLTAITGVALAAGQKVDVD